MLERPAEPLSCIVHTSDQDKAPCQIMPHSGQLRLDLVSRNHLSFSHVNADGPGFFSHSRQGKFLFILKLLVRKLLRHPISLGWPFETHELLDDITVV